MTKIKGTALVIIPIFIKIKFGENGFNQWLSKLSPEAKKVYKSEINISEWYPLTEISTEPTIVLCDLFFDGSHDGSFELGRFSAQYALKGIYKLFVKIGSPLFLIKRASVIMGTYYDPAKIEAVELQKGKVLMTITDFEESHDVVEVRIKGWIEEAVKISGGKEVNVIISKSLAKGDDSIEYITEYK